MNNHNRVLKRYIRSVRKVLPCYGKIKKSIISQLTQSVEDFLDQNPHADIDMIQAHFGTPQQIAVSCVDVQNTAAMLKKYNFKRKLRNITAGAMAAVILALTGYIAWDTYLDTADTATSYIVETIIVVPGEIKYVEPQDSEYHHIVEEIVYINPLT